MTSTRRTVAWHRNRALFVVLLVFPACGTELPTDPDRDCRTDGVGCDSGYICMATRGPRHVCVMDGSATDMMALASDGQLATDAAIERVDVGTEPDAGSEPDQDRDGISDTSDNCPQVVNADQVDGDADGLGDACDEEPAIQNFVLTGHFLLLSGRSVDEVHSLKSKITTGVGESTDGQLIVIGEITP